MLGLGQGHAGPGCQNSMNKNGNGMSLEGSLKQSGMNEISPGNLEKQRTRRADPHMLPQAAGIMSLTAESPTATPLCVTLLEKLSRQTFSESPLDSVSQDASGSGSMPHRASNPASPAAHMPRGAWESAGAGGAAYTQQRASSPERAASWRAEVCMAFSMHVARADICSAFMHARDLQPHNIPSCAGGPLPS